jgi:DNA-binding CsgD family transcriptional regulator
MSRLQLREQDAVTVLEAAHVGHEPLQDWLDGLAASVRHMLTGLDLTVGVIVRRHAGHWEALAGDAEANRTGPLAEFGQMLPMVPPEALDAYYRNPRHAYTHASVCRAFPEAKAVGDGFLAALGMSDSVSTLSQGGDGVSMVLFGMARREIIVEPSQRLLLTRVAAHLEAALRVRINGAAPVAILDVDGSVRDAEGLSASPTMRARLSQGVKAVERGRRRRERAQRGAIDAWHALVSGRFALVEQAASSRREYHVYENPPHVWTTRSLTTTEANVLELSARGMSGKLVAYTLGISFARVSEALASAAAKTGCGSRNGIVRLAAAALAPSGEKVDQPRLTDAEREIIARLADGWSNAAIARARGTSEKTVANQVGALLKKFGSSSRRALAAQPAG